jgi:elongin-A
VTPPKTLFQKTRSEASKIQKTIYSARIIPPMPRVRGYRVLSNASVKSPPSPPTSSCGTRVIVKAISYRRPSASSLAAPASALSHPPFTPVLPTKKPLAAPGSPPTSPTPQDSRQPPTPSKKDPMAALFMPKHRTHSQLPRQSLSRPVI